MLLQHERRERERQQTAKEEIEWVQQRAQERKEQAQDKLQISNLLQDLKDKEADLSKMRLTLSMRGRSLSASRIGHPRKPIAIIDQEEAGDSEGGAESFSNRCTIGIMLSGARVDNLVVGGPAYTTSLEKGDEIVLIDGVGVEVDDMPAAIIGADLPGSIVILTIKKAGSGDMKDVEVVRVESRELADKRRLFELFTDIENLIGTLELGNCCAAVVSQELGN
jgi:C-terminal processing protease CtpA/Prc